MELGILSLSDLNADPATGRTPTAAERTAAIVDHAVQADRLGLDVFALGEHHGLDFAVSSPAVVLAAIAARTESIRLTTAVTVLGVLDPVRVHEDFSTLDLLSDGRTELIVGRSAFTEPFALFGERLEDYDALFQEKLLLLLRLREEPRLSWQGRFRPPILDAEVAPRPVQPQLPVWIGVGGSPDSAARAGHLGLPMTLGYIGGPLAGLRRTIDAYRAAGERAGHADRLRVGVSTHFFAAGDEAEAQRVFPHYHEYLRPKTPGGRGFHVDAGSFAHGRQRGQALLVGTVEQLTEKILDLRDLGIDRFFGQVDWGALPPELVAGSISRLATEIAPAVRGATSAD